MSSRFPTDDEDDDDLGPPTRLQSFFASRNDAVSEEPLGIFADPEGDGRQEKGKPWLAIAFALIAMPSFGALVWYAYSWSEGTVDVATLPVVVAQDGPIKVKPENEGGMEVPYQDKLILNQIAEATDAREVEHLLDEPEAPAVIELPEEIETQLEPPLETAAGPRTEDGSGDAIAGLIESAEEAKAPISGESKAVEPKSANPKTAKPKSAIPEKKAAVPDEAEPVAAAKTVAKEPAPVQEPAQQAALPAAGDFKIQLAAVKSNASAVAEWGRLQKKHQGLLGSLALIVEKAVVNGTTYHRVQAGPLADRAAAEGLCAKLKAASQPCIFKKIR